LRELTDLEQAIEFVRWALDGSMDEAAPTLSPPAKPQPPR